MRKLFNSFVALTLIVVTVICTACVPVPTDPPEEKDTFLISGAYNVSIAQGIDQCREITDASVTLRRAVKAVYGVTCTAFDKVDEGVGNIIIGNAGDPDSDRVAKDLGVNDFAYEIVSDKLIVIVGGSMTATVNGVNYFCSEVLGYDGKTAKATDVELKIGATGGYSADYGCQQITVDGVPYGEITVAIHKYQDLSVIQTLVTKLGSYTGEPPVIKTYSELTGDERAVICVGSLTRAGEPVSGIVGNAYRLSYEKTETGFTASICASSNSSYAAAQNKFFADAELTHGDTCSLTLGEPDFVYSEDIADLDDWTVKESDSLTVTDGVIYKHYSFTDTKKLPYEVFTMEVDLGKVDMYMGSGGDSYEYSPTTKGTVADHIRYAKDNGKVVYGGINADFFRISSDYTPLGLTIKNGTVISQGDPARPYVGFTADGRCIVDDKVYETSGYTFTTAVGGSHIILKNGIPTNVNGTDEFSVTAHPRTLVGVKADGTLVMAVVDGRRSQYSNGAPLDRCAKLMAELGCVSAINLDGGGSSTLCTVEDGSTKTKNKPSDFSLRRIYNSLLIVEKTKD